MLNIPKIKISFIALLSFFMFLVHAEDYEMAKNVYINNRAPLDPDSIILAFNQFVQSDELNIQQKYPDASRLSSAINEKLQEAFESSNSSAEISKWVYQASSYVVPVVGAVTTPLAGPISLAVGTFVTSVSEFYLNDRISQLEDLKNENGRKIASSILSEYRKQWGDTFKEEFQGLTADDVIKKINRGKTHPIMESLYSGLTPGEKNQLDLNIVYGIKDLIALQHMDLQREIDRNDNSLEETRNLVISTQAVLDKFRNVQNKRMRDILSAQNIIKKRVDEVAEKMADHPDDSDKASAKLVSVLLSKDVPVKAKMAILNEIAHQDESPDQKKDREFQESVKIVTDKSIKLITAANDLYSIAENVGFFSKNPKTQEKFSKVLKVSNAALGAVTAYFSGNPIGAVAAATSIFAKAKPDASALRHQEVMNALSEIRHEQYNYYIDLKSDLKNLNNNLQKGVIAILTKLDDLDKKIDREFQLVKNSLIKIENDLIDIKTFQQKSYYDGLFDCQCAYDGILKIKEQKHLYQDNKFLSYQKFFDYFTFDQPIVKKIERCRKFLMKILPLSEAPSDFFYLASYEGRVENGFLQNELSNYRNIIKLFFELPPKMRQDMYPKLATSASTMSDIDRKYYDFKDYYPNRNPLSTYSGTEDQTITKLIYPQVLMKLATYSLELLPYFDLLRDGIVRSADELVHMNRIADQDKILKHFQVLIDLSLIQQNLMSGDAFLPVFYLQLKKGPVNEKTIRVQNEMKAVLDNNKILGRNFLLYVTKKQHSDFIYSPHIMYDMALGSLESKIPKIENNYLDVMKPFIKQINKDLDQVILGNNKFYRLPSADLIKADQLYVRTTAISLAKLRNHIVELRSRQKFLSNLKSDERKFYIDVVTR